MWRNIGNATLTKVHIKEKLENPKTSGVHVLVCQKLHLEDWLFLNTI